MMDFLKDGHFLIEWLRCRSVMVFLIVLAAWIVLEKIWRLWKNYMRPLETGYRRCPHCRAVILQLALECPECRRKV